MANLLSNLFSKGAANLVDAVGTAIDKNVTSDEERKALENEAAKAKMNHDMEMRALGIKETEAYLGDTQSARTNQTQIQVSEHASWLAKNVHSLMAIGIVGLTFGMYGWIISAPAGHLESSGVKEIVIYILGALTTISTQVAAYYYGSSQGSAKKSEIMDRMSARATEK
ncbi:MAG: hypothetical protein OEW58_05495 [Gammaproteobacteria bacterium]|nr:hypothetical protein [Gammaproteobacteria bacterium]